MSKPKYKNGQRIYTVSQFASCNDIWFKWNGKTRHRSVIESLQYHTLCETISRGSLYTAIPIEDKTTALPLGVTYEVWGWFRGKYERYMRTTTKDIRACYLDIATQDDKEKPFKIVEVFKSQYAELTPSDARWVLESCGKEQNNAN